MQPALNMLFWIINLKINDKLDIFDHLNTPEIWRICTVKNIEHHQKKKLLILTIGYDGYPDSYDETININTKNKIFNANKIAKLGTFTSYHNYLTYKKLSTECKLISNPDDNDTQQCIECDKKCCTKCKAIDIERSECGQCCFERESNDISNILQTSLTEFEKNIIQIIASFSVGFTVECDNMVCHNVINIIHEWQFKCNLDDDGNNIYHHCVDDIDTDNKLSSNFIYGKQRRIFCSECTKNTLTGCQYNECNVKDTKQYLKAKKISKSSSYICPHHLICRPNCPRYNIYECKQCEHFREYNTILNTLETIPNITQNNKKPASNINVSDKIITAYTKVISLGLKLGTYSWNGLKQTENIISNIEEQKKREIIQSFTSYTNPIRSLCAAINTPTVIDVPNHLINAYKSALSLGLSLDTYSWNGLQDVKHIIDEQKENNVINEIKNNLSSASSSKSIVNAYNDQTKLSILDIITSYSTGVMVECCNNLCENEVNFNNETQFIKHQDCDDRKITYHTIKDMKQFRKNLSYRFIYGEYRRIFCNDCSETDKRIKSCSFSDCKVEDIYVNKIISMNGNIVCDNHRFCKKCNDQPLSNDVLKPCIKCKGYFCKNCHLQQICKQCISYHDKQYIVDIIDNCNNLRIDILLIDVIASLSTGCITQCCNRNGCNKPIYINNYYEFNINNVDENGDKIYSYYAIDAANHKSVSIFGQQLIIFCKDCSSSKSKCEYYKTCGNFDTSTPCICLIHPKCNQCGTQEEEKRYEKCLNRKCFHYVCNDCKVNKFCSDCFGEKELNSQKYIIKQSINHSIDDNKIFDVITNYSMGYILSCCNKFKCKNQIIIRNEYNLLSNWDNYGEKIYQYRPVYRQNTVKVYGQERRVFCSGCVLKKEIKMCNEKNCNFMDINERDFCQNHNQCNQCNDIDTLFLCERCNENYCINCSKDNYRGWCSKCVQLIFDQK